MTIADNFFTSFNEAITQYALPERFTYPFYYEPHPLCVLAVKELQLHLETQTNWQHDFNKTGKMFGVLLVQNKRGEIGYLAAFSGKIADSNHHANFVPPVFDMLTAEGFFRKGQDEITHLSEKLQTLKNKPDLLKREQTLHTEQEQEKTQIAEHRTTMIAGRRDRKKQRLLAEKILDSTEFERLKNQLGKESIKHKNQLRDLTLYWGERVGKAQQHLSHFTDEITALTNKRKLLSASLQRKIFDHYRFLNQQGIEKSLYAIFKNTPQQTPPAGAGECATPKLLHYAFQNNLKPLAMAEFWWGVSPKSQIRQHKNFYAACLGKCQPILNHMLEGIELDENPLLTNPAEGKTIGIVYEDDDMVVINKPAEFLSVPGKNIEDSVQFRMKQLYPNAKGPLIVHRLDMSTSGLMVIALSKQAHKQLQKQFINRTVEKRYVALLEGILTEKEGVIDLPLRVDLDDRPRQLVCYDYGRAAQTKWQLIEQKNNQSKVYFYPKTGRTHQLRVHSAHIKGLNMPIVGDDLYGNKADRLHLHAESLSFSHPITQKIMQFQIDANFQ
jgi:tRNA pseudouridine32 synthase/23S rRNA pseudouridine746 synthase